MDDPVAKPGRPGDLGIELAQFLEVAADEDDLARDEFPIDHDAILLTYAAAKSRSISRYFRWSWYRLNASRRNAVPFPGSSYRNSHRSDIIFAYSDAIRPPFRGEFGRCSEPIPALFPGVSELMRTVPD